MIENVPNSNSSKNTRHILSLSGGKDSTALSLFLKDKFPEMEYIFCDTGEELQETYDYLEKIEARLGKSVTRLNPDRDFKFYLDIYRGVLPDPRTRWCTRMLKIKPFESYVGDDPVKLYVGIRADESHRKGYISTKPNIASSFPFVEHNLRHKDVLRILDENQLGLPDYYKWRSRSGCYFCFFQQHIEWVGLYENNKDYFWKAASFEKYKPETGEIYTWIQGETLEQLSKPERIAEIKRDHKMRIAVKKNSQVVPETPLFDVFNDGGCLICHL